MCCDENNNILVKSDLSLRKETYKLEEISAFLLVKLKNMAQNYLDCEVSKAVITVPAYFNDNQRQSTKDAATIAGLECVRIINEPTSSALAYGLENVSLKSDKDVNVLVYDFGGGTLDVSIVNICHGVFEVLSSTGNTHLGGEDFDNRVMGYCIKIFQSKNNIKINNISDISPVSLQFLKIECEKAKNYYL